MASIALEPNHTLLPRNSRRAAWLSILLLTILSGAAILPGMAGTEVLGQGDEAMHITTVRQSLERGTYTMPSLALGPNYFKPPLLFWMAMATESILGSGFGLLAVRLPSFIFALITVYFLFFMLRDFRVSNRRALFISCIYLFSLGVFKFGRLLMMEQGMAAAFAAGAFFFLRYLRTRAMVHLLAAGFISGIGFWFKGPLFQFYTGLFLAAWAGMQVFRFRATAPHWPGQKKIIPTIRVLFYFHLAALPAVIAWFVLLLANEAGQGILHFFFVTENIGKFSHENQPIMRLFGGWLMYTFPWTIAFAAGFIPAMRRRLRTPAHLAGRILLITAILATFLHLVPNRKDAYYIIPFLGPALASVALLTDRSNGREKRLLYINFYFMFAAWLFIAFVIYIAGGSLPTVALTLGGAILTLVLIMVWKAVAEDEWRARLAGLAVGVMLVGAVQFLMIPAAHRPLLPEKFAAMIPTENSRSAKTEPAKAEKKISGAKVCVISREPWDAMQLRNILPGTNVRHSYPNAPGNGCADGKHRVITLRAGELKAPGYRKIGEWKLWRTQIDARDILPNLKTYNKTGKLFAKGAYYETAQ